MNKELKTLYERFEIEIWLYLDGSLTKEEMNFWDEQISKHSELKKLFNQTINTLDIYHSENKIEIENDELNELLLTATKTKGIQSTINSFVSGLLETLFSNNLSIAKVVFTSTLAVAALLILLITDKPNAVKNISNDILSWRGSEINKQIYEVDESIETLSMEEWEKYELIQNNYDEWEQSYFLLNKEIEQMKKDLDDISL